MLYIKKGQPSVQVREEINRVKRETGWNQNDSPSPEIARMTFDMLDKSIIRAQLLKEQRYLCAYCMRRIENDNNTTIEHWRPIEQDGTGALDYGNMMACCDGGRSISADPHVLCCDASKGKKPITISPFNQEHMGRIRYNRDGIISIFPDDQALSCDINAVLQLNGSFYADGKSLDTSTRLIAGRRQVYQRYIQLIENAQKKGKSVSSLVRKRIAEIKSAEKYEGYAGVWLYFLERKLRHVG